MPIELELSLSPTDAHNEAAIGKAIAERWNGQLPPSSWRILRRSIDARHRNVKFLLRTEVFAHDEEMHDSFQPRLFESVHSKDHVVIVGAGPAGLFAALRCIELGIKPVIIERGKDVQQRRRDLAAIHKEHIVNPESNYCFGEGGAGTYSDGKLYTRSTKRGDVRSVLETLVQFGASPDILIDAHPHIGTNKLPKIIAAMRDKIIECGGEVHFNKKMTDLTIKNGMLESITTAEGEVLKAKGFILATGHSARDIFQLLSSKKILLEFKPFALGVRAEHPQAIVDAVQYNCDIRPEILPPAAYSLVHQVNGRGVYSFCMCPGGIIAPCATAQDEIVTNGWSPSKRNNPWANSGIVVPVLWEDVKKFHGYGALAGMKFQEETEHNCWIAGGKTQSAPAQRLIDFVEGKISNNLPPCSYQPGLNSIDLNTVLPAYIASHLREGFRAFGKKMKGYYTNDALLVAPESRTSSPVRIPREKETLQHPELANLYPCAEGAGYAGGIVSAAIDGEKVAQMVRAVHFDK